MGCSTKLLFPDSPLGPATFADFDRGDDPSCADQLLVYIGGAIRMADYEARREGEPPQIGLAREAGYAGAMLVLSAHPAIPGLAHEALGPLTRHFAEELLPAVGFEPSAMGLVGMSFGTSLAVLLARSARFPVRALAALAPAGAAEAAELAEPSLGPLSCPILIGTNLDDPYREYAESFAIAANRFGLRPVRAMGPGEHRFADYAANGLAARAFRFVAERMEGASTA